MKTPILHDLTCAMLSDRMLESYECDCGASCAAIENLARRMAAMLAPYGEFGGACLWCHQHWMKPHAEACRWSAVMNEAVEMGLVKL